jgi:hypothetical protein
MGPHHPRPVAGLRKGIARFRQLFSVLVSRNVPRQAWLAGFEVATEGRPGVCWGQPLSWVAMRLSLLNLTLPKRPWLALSVNGPKGRVTLLNRYHIKFLHHLVKHDIAFLIIGGQARRFLDANRQTMDLDIWVRIHKEDIAKLERAILEWAKEHPQHALTQNLVAPLSLRPGVQIKFPDTDGVWFSDRSNSPGQVGTKDRIDVLTSLHNLDFNECMRRAQQNDVEGVTVFSLCPADLDRAEGTLKSGASPASPVRSS